MNSIHRIVRIQNASHNFSGYDYLTRALSEANTSGATSIGLDMGGVSWFAALMAAPLQVMLDRVRERGVKVALEHPPDPKVSDTLRRNGFLCGFGLEPLSDSYRTSVQLRRLGPEVAKDGAKFLMDDVLPSQYFPTTLTKQERRHLLDSFGEVFTNVEGHACTDVVTACGQYFVSGGRLGLIVADGGLTIPHVVERHMRWPLSDVKAVEWALDRGNTTRPNKIGGDGLSNIRDFLRKNGGTLTIVSRRAYWSQTGGVAEGRLLDHPFPGTSVSWEVVTNGEKTTYATEVSNPW